MNSTAEILACDVASESGAPEGVLRIARYSVYPRAERNQGVQSAYTRLPRGTRFVLVTTTPEVVGELLRVSIHGLGERDAHVTLARVVSCRQAGESRFELSLQGLETHGPRTVRARVD